MVRECDDDSMASTPTITFRRLASADLATLHELLNEPGAVDWWEGDDVFARLLERTQVCACPFAANEPSWSALAAGGFRFVGVIDDEAGPCNLMVLDRPDTGPS